MKRGEFLLMLRDKAVTEARKALEKGDGVMADIHMGEYHRITDVLSGMTAAELSERIA